MARPKKVVEEVEKKDVVVEAPKAEEKPQFDPSLPESKQRHLR